MQKCRLSAVAVLWLSTATTVFAEYTAHQEKPVIVTATRTAQTADASLASVTVISRKDIERQQARSIQDLFRGLPGINIINNGGPGKNTSVSMRGTETDHVLVMIDNIKVGSATSGTTAFENIPIEQIERIEIVRGPRSSLYGSEAIGGVIHIFTRKGDGGGYKPSFSFGGGSYDSLNGSVGFPAAANKAGLICQPAAKGQKASMPVLENLLLAVRVALLMNQIEMVIAMLLGLHEPVIVFRMASKLMPAFCIQPAKQGLMETLLISLS